MCGICGYIGIESDDLVRAMTDELYHRGPDDVGYFHQGDVHLGHRRLSIIDLSGGHQPMESRDGRLVIVFNGEIYNYRELRDRLEGKGHRFETASDTEVLLRMYEEYGLDALQELNGMYAFAVYDRSRDELLLVRDRIGIKPLYYARPDGKLLFASEMKAILQYRDWTPTLNPLAVQDYLMLRYIPGDSGIFRDVKRLPAGHYLRYRRGDLSIHRYWEVPQYEGPYPQSDEEYLEQFGELMEQSVRRRLVSDVSLGAYLSGGLDSSVIVALMSKLTNSPVKTFSVGFDYEHDELHEAAETAKLLGCEHHEIACRASDVELLPDIVHHLDEPMGDAIIIPMFQLSEAAKREVTVILTGEGGDEILGGYLFHKFMNLGNLYHSMVPKPVRDWLVSPLLAATPTSALNVAFQYPAYLGKRGKRKALDYLGLLEPDRLEDAYRHLISLFDARDTRDLYTSEFGAELAAGSTARRSSVDGAYLNRLIRLQFDHWLPDNMLFRQDKTGMAHSIEGRVPFLDHKLVEFAMRLPPRLKIKGLTGKYILRQYAQKLLPPEVTGRKKMPFYVPIENYFQEPSFRELMDELLGEKSIRERGLFRPDAVMRIRRSMERREFLYIKQAFSLMVLELWFRMFVDRTWTTTSRTNELQSVAH